MSDCMGIRDQAHVIRKGICVVCGHVPEKPREGEPRKTRRS